MTSKICKVPHCDNIVAPIRGNSRKLCCSHCDDKYNKGSTVNRWLSTMKRDACLRAEKRSIPSSFTIEDLYGILPEEMICPVLEIPMIIGKDNWKNSPSLDRINPKLGYVVGNIQMISYLANAMKSAATPDELNRFADWVKENY